MQRLLFALPLIALAACGPNARGGGSGGNGDGVDGGSNGSSGGNGVGGSGGSSGGACVPQAEICGDGIDNDCDGQTDCSDPDCSGVGSCPVCGMVNDPEAMAINLPDGVSSGKSCSTDADCSGSTPNCIIAPHGSTSGGVLKECHASYTSTLNFIGFPDGATLADTTKLLNICLDIEHSYLHDLQIEILAPPDANGTRFKTTVHEFLGRIGPEIFVGIPNESDEKPPIKPGTPWHYCWVPSAASTMYDANLPVDMDAMDYDPDFPDSYQVPAGNYKPMDPFDSLKGAPLNGTWTMRVTDMYKVDNGTLKGWSISFDPSLVTSCTGPIIQ